MNTAPNMKIYYPAESFPHTISPSNQVSSAIAPSKPPSAQTAIYGYRVRLLRNTNTLNNLPPSHCLNTGQRKQSANRFLSTDRVRNFSQARQQIQRFASTLVTRDRQVRSTVVHSTKTSVHQPIARSSDRIREKKASDISVLTFSSLNHA